jgi:hypothetical protein
MISLIAKRVICERRGLMGNMRMAASRNKGAIDYDDFTDCQARDL